MRQTKSRKIESIMQVVDCGSIQLSPTYPGETPFVDLQVLGTTKVYRYVSDFAAGMCSPGKCFNIVAFIRNESRGHLERLFKLKIVESLTVD